jgi:sugar lactone lactonase YvrE
LIVAESMAQRLNAFDIGADGALSGRRIYKDLSKLDLGTGADVPGLPDGIAIDAEDSLWVSPPSAGKFVRIDTAGTVTHCVDLGDAHPIACALGGGDGCTLFMSSSQVARDANQFEEMANKRTKTHLLTARVDVPHGKGLP